MRSLTVYIPGLCGPDIPIHPDDLPNLPALNWFLNRGLSKIEEQTSPSYTLCELFGLSKDPDTDFPIAAISRLSDDNHPPEGQWLRADPVHVSADRDGLILLDNNRFKLSQHDALVLATDINQVLEGYDIELEVPNPYRWYLKINAPVHLKTTPIDKVIGQNISACMPCGAGHINFIQLMNEIQMILHTSEINQKREKEKMLPINSIWFWGYGKLPEIISPHWSFISSDEILGKGLAMLATTPFTELPASYDDINHSGSSYTGLLIINALQKYSYYYDLETWLEALMQYEANWFAPLLRALKTKQLDRLMIRSNRFSVSLDNRARYKFWKNKKTIQSFKP